MVRPPPLPRLVRSPLTWVICGAFRISHGPARVRNLANLAILRPLLPCQPASRKRYSSTGQASLATHQRRRIHSSTHSLSSPLPVPPQIFHLRHPHRYHSVLL